MTDEEQDLKPTRPVPPSRPTPSRPPRMAKPIHGGLREVMPEPIRPAEMEPEPEPPVAAEPMPPVEAEAHAQPEPPLPPAELPVEPEKAPEPVPAPAAESETTKSGRTAEPPLPATIRETLRRVDEAWQAFHAAAARFPAERMDEHLSEHGWTRKQMLFHVAVWHDLTADRLIKLINTGVSARLERDVDAVNASAARRAVGKTAGEILKDTEATFYRLRRQLQRMTDAQLRIDDGWAAQVIAGNTYGHYAEHWADVHTHDTPPAGARR